MDDCDGRPWLDGGSTMAARRMMLFVVTMSLELMPVMSDVERISERSLLKLTV